MDSKKVLIGVVALAVIGLAVWQFGGEDQNNTNGDQVRVQQQERQGQNDVMMEKEAMMEQTEYQNGTYTAIGNYTSPAQEEELEITITLEDGVVTAAEFDGKATHEISTKLQGMFAEGFEEEVVGKNIDEIDLEVVNGSSLTPLGFMDALEKVKEDAAQA